MRKLLGIAVASSSALCAASATAQFGNPGFANPSTPGIETGRPTEDTKNTSDEVFLRQAAIGNRAEVELANLASQRATTEAVKEFASRMVTDHNDALQQVERLARASDTPLPRGLDMDHTVVLEELREVDAGMFDLAYIRSQIAAHQRTAQLLTYQIGAGQSDEVRGFATDALPVVMRHLEAAKAIHAELTGPTS